MITIFIIKPWGIIYRFIIELLLSEDKQLTNKWIQEQKYIRGKS